MKVFNILFGALLSLGLFSGCGGDSTPKSEEATAAPSSVAAPSSSISGDAPVNGDAFITASIGEPSNLIPALATDSASSEINAKIYNGLLKIDENLNIVPDLAESFEISNDGLTITFNLRRDVFWHDGEPYTSRDAMFTYELMADPSTPTAYGEPYIQVKQATAPDDYTFQVTYERPLARALISWCFGQMPAHLLKGQNLDAHPLSRLPVGTGPYKLDKWEPGQRVILKANDDYFLGRPFIDQVVMKIIPDLSAQMMELLAGNIDIMNLTPDQYEEKAPDKSFNAHHNLFRYSAFTYTYLGFNFANPLFQDLRVRRAVALAIDKDELIDGVLLGLGSLANGPFKADMWANNHNVKPYPYDPEQARALLAEAGWLPKGPKGMLEKDGQKLQFTIMTNQGNKVREQTGLIIQARLAEVGID
ncbi:MAG: peptide-binding protein, partial [Candidatus Adiutrix sp.]